MNLIKVCFKLDFFIISINNMETSNIDKDHQTIKISYEKSPKKLTCIICNAKLSVKDDKHNCLYRTNNAICINYNDN
jgi:hypothetical protein